MTNRIGTDLVRYFDLPFGNQRASNACPQQVDAFIQGVCPEHRKNKIANKFFADIIDEDVFFLDAQLQGLVARRAQFFALTQIGGVGHDLTFVFRLKPF